MKELIEVSEFIQDYNTCLIYIKDVENGNSNYEMVKKYIDDTIEKYRYKIETLNFYNNTNDVRNNLHSKEILNIILQMLIQYGILKYGEEKINKILKGELANE